MKTEKKQNEEVELIQSQLINKRNSLNSPKNKRKSCFVNKMNQEKIQNIFLSPVDPNYNQQNNYLQVNEIPQNI